MSPILRSSRRPQNLSMDSSDYPPTQKGRHHEIRAQGLREFAGLRSDEERLDPFELARYAKLLVVKLEDVVGLDPEFLDELTRKSKDNWSGGAASQVLPDGSKLIILNPTHAKNRHHATLMEEVSHVFLGHQPSRLAIQKRDRQGNILARDYNAEIEEEAYATGAAALVPYRGLKLMVERRKTAIEIARHYGVSKALVEYRIKISRLWAVYSQNLFSSGS
jgi:Zn-dependent peptidase ImmA (M78 family)